MLSWLFGRRTPKGGGKGFDDKGPHWKRLEELEERERQRAAREQQADQQTREKDLVRKVKEEAKSELLAELGKAQGDPWALAAHSAASAAAKGGAGADPGTPRRRARDKRPPPDSPGDADAGNGPLARRPRHLIIDASEHTILFKEGGLSGKLPRGHYSAPKLADAIIGRTEFKPAKWTKLAHNILDDVPADNREMVVEILRAVAK
ncbi:unnamed protein product [Prorocentrum cordatum]|uniref:Uncharacterized protein n=1 Tax=Prorocentrum cordatum TaxID=2364126 RepID=A0ABN9XIE4_9DINO|nr:unnamed protein product [Polarella glacialis]